MKIIKTKKFKNGFTLNLIHFQFIKGYEVQYSNNDDIIMRDGMYPNKKEGLKAFNTYLKKVK